MYPGCNRTQFATVSASIKGMRMERAYANGGAIPTSLPTPSAPGVLCAMDIKPSNWQSLYDGSGDEALNSLIASAPPGTLLTAYHERDKYAYSNSKPFGPDESALIDEHLYALTGGTNVKYGSCLTQGDGPQPLSPWTIPGLDFYAIDLYSNPVSPMRANTALYRAFEQMPGWPDITTAVLECNTSANVRPSQQYRRPDWFREVYSWLLKYNGLAFCTFWNPSGPDSGPWDPHDQATIYALGNITSDAPNNVV